MNVRLATIGDYVEPVATWNPATKPEDRFVYIDLSAVDQTEKRIAATASVSGSEAPSRARQLVKKGDILVSTVRPNLNGVAPVTEDFDGATASTGFCVLRPRPEKLSGSYLMHWVRSPQFIESMVKQATGASYPAVSDRIIKGSLIPLPQLNEQVRIASILDNSDMLSRKRKRAVELLDNLTRSTFLDMFGDPARNTRALPSAKLGQIGEWRSGGTPPRGQAKYFEGNIPWFSSGELNSIYVNETAESVTEEALIETSAREVPPNSLMLGMYDTAALKSSISTVRSSCNQAIAFAQIDNSLAETLYVYYAIQLGKDEFRSQQRGVRQKNLNLSMIKGIEIPLPSLDAQRAFVLGFQKNARMSKTLQKSMVMMNLLFASLQSRAFSGQL